MSIPFDVSQHSSPTEFSDDRAKARAQAAPPGAPGAPPSPRLVTRGESEPKRTNAFVDWLSFTVADSHFKRPLDWVPALAEYLQVLELTHDAPTRGVLGFTHSAPIVVPCEGERVNVGKLAWGGESQNGRLYLSMSGTLCARVSLWEPLALVLALCEARISRVDLAHDDLEGVRSVDYAVELYDSGQFNSGGRNPNCELQGDWKQVSGRGRTFYVGRREHGKLLRVYEKGKQLGDPISPWVRWEVEWHNKSRWIPYEVLTEPGRFLGGSFPALNFVSEERTRIRTESKAVHASLDHLTHCLSQSYGKTINALRLQGLDPEDIVAQVMRSGLPKRLQHPVAASKPGTKLYPDADGKP